MTITVTCDECGKDAQFKGQYIPDGWHFESFDTIINGVVWKHVCPDCYAKMLAEREKNDTTEE